MPQPSHSLPHFVTSARVLEDERVINVHNLRITRSKHLSPLDVLGVFGACTLVDFQCILAARRVLVQYGGTCQKRAWSVTMCKTMGVGTCVSAKCVGLLFTVASFPLVIGCWKILGELV